MHVYQKLIQSDVLFGSVWQNVVLIVLNLIQVFGSIVFLSLLEKSNFDSSTVWWILIDGTRVLAATIVRIESLLKDEDNEREFIRKFLCFSNILGLVLGMLVSVYILTILNKKNSFAFEILAGSIVLVHLLATVPAIAKIIKEPQNPDGAQSDPLIPNQMMNYEHIVEDVDQSQAQQPVYLPPSDFQAQAIEDEVEHQRLIWQLIQQNNEREAEYAEDRSLRAAQDLEYQMMQDEELFRQAQQESLAMAAEAEEIQPVPEPEPEEPEAVQIQVREPPPEVEKGDNTVICRIRLPDGTQLKRRFLQTDKISQLHDYLEYELVTRNIKEGDGFVLVTTPPRIVYEDLDATLAEAGLIMRQSTSRREPVSPMVYCEQ